MKLKLQRRLAASIAGCSVKRVRIDFERLHSLGIETDDLKQAITKADIRSFIDDGVLKILPKKGVSRARANKTKRQKSKGRRKGEGSRKGKGASRLSNKQRWMLAIRAQRKLIKELKERGLINTATHQKMYKKAKGGFFRSRRHIKLYLDENKLIIQPNAGKEGSQKDAVKSEVKSEVK